MADTVPPAPSRPGRSFARRALRAVLAALLLAVFILVGLGLLLGSERGLSWSVAAINRLAAGTLAIDHTSGSLRRHLTVLGLKLDVGDTHARVDRAELDWRPLALLHGKLDIASFTIGSLTIDSKPSDQPTPFPTRLRLPLALEVGQLSIGRLWLAQSKLELTGIAATLSSDGLRHRLQLASLHTPWGRANGRLALTGDAPYALDGSVAFDGGLDTHPVSGTATLSGNLRQLRVASQLRSGDAGVVLDARLVPFATSLPGRIHSLRAELRDVELPVFLPGAPKARLAGGVYVEPAAGGWRGHVDLANGEAGAIDAGRIPVERLAGELHFDGKRLLAHELTAYRAGGSLRVNGSAATGALALSGEARAIDPRSIYSSLVKGAASGTLKLTGPLIEPRLEVELADPRLGLAGAMRWARQTGHEAIVIERARFTHAGGEADISGRLGLDSRLDYAAEVVLRRFHPDAFVAMPRSEFNLTAKAHGAFKPNWRVDAQFKLLDSHYGRIPLSGEGALAIGPTRLEQADLSLRVAANTLRAKGRLGLADDRLLLDIDAPDLALPGLPLAGKAKGKITLSGPFAQVAVEGDMQVDGLRLPGNTTIEHLAATLKLQASATGRADAKVTAAGVQAGGQHIDKAELTLAGTRAAHDLAFVATGQLADTAVDMSLAAHGALGDGWHWQGTLQRLDNKGRYAVALMAPVSLALAPDAASLGAARLKLIDTELQLDTLDWSGGRVSTRGAAQAVDLASLIRFSGRELPLSTDLVFGLRWDLKLADHLNGTLELTRQRGDLVLEEVGSADGLPMKLERAAIVLRAVNDHLTGQAELKSTTLGALAGDVDVFVTRGEQGWQVSRTTPYAWKLAGEMSSIAWAGPLLGPVTKLGGRLAVDLRAQGFVGKPNLAGWLKASEVKLSDPERGVDFKDGRVSAVFQQDRVVMQDFHLAAGKGTLTGSGTLLLGLDMPSVDMKLVARQFAVLTRPDRQLTVTGEGGVRYVDQQLHIDAKLSADSGHFEVGNSDVPALGDDVVVVGRAPRNAKKGGSLPLYLTASFDLGERLTVRGKGLDATLGGSVLLRAAPKRALTAAGTVTVTRGRYTAYGQNLSVSRGNISFQGPIDNPLLDIVAIRPGLSVEVGVQVSGTALAPRVQLTSDTPMPDAEKLSWLVLGKPSSGLKQGDAASLLMVASGLLGGDTANSLVKSLADSVGLDEISIGQSENTTSNGSNGSSASSNGESNLSTQVVTLGKRLSDRAYLAYEQGLTGASAALKLTYQLTRSLSFVARAGQQQSQVDLFYTHAFD
ncbi:translocation/assembly module TamB domain-containing protein [Chitinivorax sp. PXF-14]|uniref:translocation/assembly module TamB domain-containing protein n=1 Tax=Chitinivorax sp. PXF-14 TaxID=3230488 RepID=UPI003466B580